MSNNHSTKENRLSQAESLPRSIPTVVLYQLDMLLEQAIKMMGNSQTPDILKPVYWDAILILRRTGMHFEDLIHLREPDNQGCNGCLEQDSGGYWWLHVHRKINKVDKIYRIPLERHHRVVEAIYRQQERVQGIPANGDIVKNAFFIAIETLRKSSHSQSASQEQIPELQDTEQTNETTQQESDKDGPLGKGSSGEARGGISRIPAQSPRFSAIHRGGRKDVDEVSTNGTLRKQSK